MNDLHLHEILLCTIFRHCSVSTFLPNLEVLFLKREVQDPNIFIIGVLLSVPNLMVSRLNRD